MELTHFDPGGKARMVDVSEKADTRREATAQGIIRMNPECYALAAAGRAEKGDVLGTARIAGIMGAKRTAELIPLCHLLNLTRVAVDFEMLPEEHAIRATCTAGTVGKTGVEMEALTGVSCALLTIYDMCKAIDKTMEIGPVRLAEKSGGKSGHFVNPRAGKGENP
jgi:cyclic pyranopterin phosphate synthase